MLRNSKQWLLAYILASTFNHLNRIGATSWELKFTTSNIRTRGVVLIGAFYGAIAILSTQEIIAKSILIYRPGTIDQFDAVVSGLNKDIQDKYNAINLQVGKSYSYNYFKEKILQIKPELTVLLGNSMVEYALRFSAENSNTGKHSKFLATMALNLHTLIDDKQNTNFCGVSYEIPGSQIITQFRYLVNRPVIVVVVFYRGSKFQSQIDTASKELMKEGIFLRSIDVEEYGKDQANVIRFLYERFRSEISKPDVDAVWVLPDTGIINKQTFVPLWINGAKSTLVPFITGIDRFVEPRLEFCVYSASHDYPKLGSHIAEIAAKILDDGIDPKAIGIEPVKWINHKINQKKLSALGISIRQERAESVEFFK